MKLTPIVLLVLAVSPPVVPARAAPPALPEDVRAALEKNAKAFNNLAVSGTRSRRMLAPAKEALTALGTHEPEDEFTQLVKFELRLQAAKIHEAFHYPPGKYQSGNGVDERSFDGTKYFIGGLDTTRPESPGILTIRTPTIIEAEQQGKASRGMVFELWYLLEAGFSGPTDASELGRPIESLVLARTAAGKLESVKDIVQNGKKLLEVTVAYPEPWASRETTPVEKDEFLQSLKGDSKTLQMRIERERRQLAGRPRLCRFLLDGSLGYAVRERWEMRQESGAVMFHTTNSDFVQVEPGGSWLPRRCEVISHAYETAPQSTAEKPLYATDIQVQKLERTPFGDEQFRVWFGYPGVSVTDFTNPKSTLARPYTYRVASPTEDLYDSQSGSSFMKKRGLFIILNALLAVVLGSVLYVRSRRKEKAIA